MLLAKQQDNEFHAIVNKEKSKESFDIFTTVDKRGKSLPPRHEEIEQLPSKDTPKQDRKEKPTNIDDRKPEQKALSPKADDSRRTRDGNPKGNNPLTMMLKDVITAMNSMSIDLRMMNQYVAMDTITDHIQKTPVMNNLKD